MKKHLIFSAAAVIAGCLLITVAVIGLINVSAKKPIDWHNYQSICINQPHVDTKARFGSEIDNVSNYCACVYIRGNDAWSDEQFAMLYDMVKQTNYMPEKFQKVVDACADIQEGIHND